MTVSRVELVVLGLLAEEPTHGYELVGRITARSIRWWAGVGRASVYQALARLEDRGLVVGRTADTSGGPERRVYRITRAGRARLEAGLRERFDDPSPYATPAGLALGFAHLLSNDDARRAVDARERAVTGLVQAVRAERARGVADRAPHRRVADAMLERQEALARAELGWLRSYRAALGDRAGAGTPGPSRARRPYLR